MRFWDSSAIVPLLVTETSTPAVSAAYADDPAVIAWWGTEVECVSALARLERDGDLSEAALGIALERLAALRSAWLEVEPTARVRSLAMRLLRVHPLRAADALQLAAATVAAEDDPRTLTLATLDDRLARSAAREGFRVLEPGRP